MAACLHRVSRVGLVFFALASLVAGSLVATGVPALAASGDWSPPNTPTSSVKPVAGTRLSGALGPSPIATSGTAFRAPAVSLPAAADALVPLASAPGQQRMGLRQPVEAPEPVRVGSSPVWVAPLSVPAGTAPQLRVSFSGGAASRRAGVASGLMWTVGRGDSGTVSASARIQLDPAALAGVSGGNLASRVRLVALPACALTTPSLPECQVQTPLPVMRDPATGRLSATVQLSASGAVVAGAPVASTSVVRDGPAADARVRPVGSGAVVLAAGSAPAGSAGDYSATSVKPSNQWSAGGASGTFSYTYPLAVPASLGGSAPTVALGYSSSDVDGLTASANAQSSWVGSGWSYEPGFIERSYLPCSKDGLPASGDTCWGYGGLEVSLNGNGMGGQLVFDDTAHVWHVSSDNGARVQLLTGAANGAFNGEYWVVTTQDGTRYYFGAGKLPTVEGGTGADPASNAAWTQPVYCPNSGDPCYSSGTGVNSFAPNMAYRWNLDYVVDPHGNTTTYSYQTETNYYARSSAHVNTAYVRGGFLTQIGYGMRAGDAAAGSPTPAAKVVFTTAQRCTGSASECSSFANLTSTTAADWPDTPFDLLCGSTGSCANGSVSYFSTYKLTQVQTLVNNAGTYKAVDTYALSSSFPDPGDTTSPSLWLDSIVHTGNDASTAVSLPAVSFGGTMMANRVPGSLTWPAYNHQRLTSITTETGEQISVSYANSTASVAACSQSATNPVLPNPSNNTMLCYQQYWTPPGQSTANSDWFEKYVVSRVTGTDLVAGSRAQVTDYTYVGGAAWHRDDSPFTDNANRSWNGFRGFGQVTTTTGATPDPVTQTQTTYLRGMDGDYNSQTGGTQKSVTVGTTLGDTVTDSKQYAGTALETDTYNQAGGTVQAKTVSLPWSAQTSSHAETSPPGLPGEKAFFVDTATTKTASLLTNGTWRTTASVSVFSPTTGLLQHRDDQGDTSLLNTAGSQETCATSTYATPPSGVNSGMLNYPARTLAVSVTAGGPVGTGSCPAATATNTVKDALTYYDGNTTTAGVIGNAGNVTQTAVIDHYSGSTPVYQDQSTAGTFDVYGRPTSTTDARGLVTTTAYTPASGQLPTSVVATDTGHNFVTTTTMDRARQLPTKVVDRNGNATSEAYDGLGRLGSVWLPGRVITQPASIGFVYAVNAGTAPSTVLTKTLRDDGTYATSYTLYDGFMQPRQQQDVTKDGTNNSLVTDIFYDSHGWTVKKTNQYYSGTGLPSTTFVQTADSAVPGETLTTFDGRGRTVASAFYSYAQPQWQTTTAYPGAERTDTTPPAGGTATSVFSDALDHVTARWLYTTAGPTGNAADANALTYVYTPAGQLARTTNQAGQVWSTTYDLRGRPVQTADPDAGQTTTTYYPAGDLKTTTDANNQTLAYTYDSLGRKTGQFSGSTSGTQLAAWTYDTATLGKGLAAGSTAFVAGAAYTTSISGYTNRGAITGASVTIPTVANGLPSDEAPLAGTYTVSSTYKAQSGLPATVGFNADGGLPAETLTYSYNQNGVLTNFGGAVGYLNSTQTDPFGRITRWTMGAMPNQVVQTNIVDTATGWVTEQFLDKESGSTHVDDTIRLYNPAGHVTAVTDTQDGGATDRQCFTYDQLGQLTTAWTDTAGTHTNPSPRVGAVGGCTTTTPSSATLGGPAAYWQSYVYNTSGNRTSSVDHALDGVTAHDVTHTYGYTGMSSQPDTLRSVANSGPGTAGTDTYGYDPAGNTTTRTIAGGPHQTVTYTPQNRTASVTDTNGVTAAYRYTADGVLLLQRDHTATGTTVTLYLGKEQLTLTTGTGTVTGLRSYTTDGGPTELRASGGTLTYEYGDAQNTHTVTVDGGAAQTETRRSFTPYGQPRGAVPAGWADNRAFVNQPTDVGLGLLGARVYEPTTGRFLQRDPVFLSDNPFTLTGYAYSTNDPVNHSDADGTRPTCDNANGIGQHPCHVGEEGWYPPLPKPEFGSSADAHDCRRDPTLCPGALNTSASTAASPTPNPQPGPSPYPPGSGPSTPTATPTTSGPRPTPYPTPCPEGPYPCPVSHDPQTWGFCGVGEASGGIGGSIATCYVWDSLGNEATLTVTVAVGDEYGIPGASIIAGHLKANGTIADQEGYFDFVTVGAGDGLVGGVTYAWGHGKACDCYVGDAFVGGGAGLGPPVTGAFGQSCTEIHWIKQVSPDAVSSPHPCGH